MVSRSYAWIDETIEHSEEDRIRAVTLAKKWSELKSLEEERYFNRQSDMENGYDYDRYEDCECEFCLKNNHVCNKDDSNGLCALCASTTELTECESERKDRERRDEKRVEQELEIELIEDKLERIGARMMRPYEHWNEDERYVEYMENRSDY